MNTHDNDYIYNIKLKRFQLTLYKIYNFLYCT